MTELSPLMKITIGNDVITSATKCEKNFLCLSGDTEHLCKVEYCVSETVHFIKNLRVNCSYKASFGNDFFCTCPIRKEIYNRFNI